MQPTSLRIANSAHSATGLRASGHAEPMKTRAAYLAAEGFVAELAHELGPVEFAHERLLLAPGPPRFAAWAQNVWLDPEIIRVASIGDAARRLRAIQRNWAVYAPRHHRRAMLIRDRL